MGEYGFFFFSEKIAQLKAFRDTLTDAEQIAAVDKEIAELKAKQQGKQGE